MPSLTKLLRAAWQYRPVITTARRIEAIGDDAYTDGALWGLAQPPVKPARPKRTTPTGKTLAVIRP